MEYRKEKIYNWLLSKYEFVTSRRTSSKINDSMFNISMWLDGRTSILEYAEINFMSVLCY
jgi:hypothetical protein